MTKHRLRIRSSWTLQLLGCCILALSWTVQADEKPVASDEDSDQRALSLQQAVQAMVGMGGLYRVDPSGDTYLYPTIKLQSDLYGMHGFYRITPGGITLHPTGMEAPDMGMNIMGGVSGYFRVTPDGEAYFQPKPHAPIGMSGETGKRNP